MPVGVLGARPAAQQTQPDLEKQQLAFNSHTSVLNIGRVQSWPSSMTTLVSALHVLATASGCTSVAAFADWLLSAPQTISNIMKTAGFEADVEAMQASGRLHRPPARRRR